MVRSLAQETDLTPGEPHNSEFSQGVYIRCSDRQLLAAVLEAFQRCTSPSHATLNSNGMRISLM